MQYIIITSGMNYLDIDAYSCCVGIRELLSLEGINAVAYSTAKYNYSISNSLKAIPQKVDCMLPNDYEENNSRFVIVDVSDPRFFERIVSEDRVIKIFDHHVGFEKYWEDRLADNAHICFIGAAATLVYLEWRNSGLLKKMNSDVAKLLLAGVLDNTLNLSSQNTTAFDVEAKAALCKIAGVNDDWCASYFLEVQREIEKDLKNALLKDIKIIRINAFLPTVIGQLTVWSSDFVLKKVSDICKWMDEINDDWFLNIIDINNKCSYFLCSNLKYRKKIGQVFSIDFLDLIVKLDSLYLRKEILKKAEYLKSN